MRKRLCITGTILSLCTIGGCQTLDAVGGLLVGKIRQTARQQAELKKVDMLRGMIRQEILFFLNWLIENNMLLANPSFTDWTPKDLGPVDEATGILLPKTVLPPPLFQRPQDIPEDIVKELHNGTAQTKTGKLNAGRAW